MGGRSFWNADDAYQQPDLSEADDEVLQPLTGADIKLAASSFPAATGVGADAISPRAIARLPDQMLDELAALLMMAEDTGDWSTAISLVLIVLLPKDGGGFRPIGLFPTLIRVWVRARSTVARDWEELTASPDLYGAKGMGAQRAAWTSTFSAEAAAANGQAYSAVLLDLVKAFELVDHRELALAAKKHGFSLKILRLSLAAYRIARTLGIEEVYSGTVVANCGITAGSGFATTELRVLLTDLLYDLRRLWPASLKLYVDDLTIAAKGEPTYVASVLTQATDYAVTAFTKLGLKVSKSKSNAVASTAALRRTVVIKTRTKALRPVKHAKLLGVGLIGGKRRTVKIQAKRIDAFASKIRRIQAIRRQGVSAVQYVQAAGVPAMMYGVECSGIADSKLKQTVSLAAAAITPPTRGKNARLSLHAVAPVCTSADPSYAAHVMPIKSWATAYWETWADRKDMSKACKDAVTKLDKARVTAWRHVSGPATALVATCKRIGWSSDDGRRFRDDLGQAHDVALDSPLAIAAAATRSVRRWCLKQTLAELPTAAPPRAAARASASNEHQPSRALVDLTPALKPLYRNAKSATKRHPSWQPKHLPYLKSAINGGQWPQARKAKLPGWQHGNQCQLCNSAVGTADHRHQCTVTCPPEGWPEPSPAAKRFIDGLSRQRQGALANRAVLAVDVPVPTPLHEHHAWQWILVPDDIQDPTLRWYIDGSRKFPRHYDIATTGCGVAVVDRDGLLVGYANATPPRWCDSSAAAETWALYLTLKEVLEVPAIYTDCLGLLRAAGRGFQAATSPKMATARIWKSMDELLDGRMQLLRQALIWIPAHTSVDLLLLPPAV